METTPGFDLTAALARWRENFTALPAVGVENLDELEGHLRDAVAELQGRGLSSEEALWVASRRMGDADKLEAEFAKVNRPAVWLNRVLWMLVGVQLWGVLGGLSYLVADATVLGGLVGAGFEFKKLSITSWSVLLPGALLFLAQLLALASSIVGVGWLLWKRETGVTKCAAKLLRSPRFVGFAALALCLLLLAVRGIPMAEQLCLLRWFGVSAVGTLSVSRTLAGLGLAVFQTVLLAVATVHLAQRRLRPAARS